jgi:hypothetical protein
MNDRERFFYDHAGFSYDPKHESREQGHERCARELASAELALESERDLFIVWDHDEIDSSDFEDTDEPHPLYVALLCRDCEPAKASIIRGYDPADYIFERPGEILESLGGIDLDVDGPDRRVIVAALAYQFFSRRASMVERGES